MAATGTVPLLTVRGRRGGGRRGGCRRGGGRRGGGAGPLRQAGLILALARIGGHPCVVIGQDRRQPPPGPAALRLARRGIRLAAGLRLPLFTVIDTPAPNCRHGRGGSGLAGKSPALADLSPPGTHRLRTARPGNRRAALALPPADRTLAAEHAWLAPLAPEGASALVYRDNRHAAELAARQGIRAADLSALGLVDVVIPEAPPGAVIPQAPPGVALCHALGHALHRNWRTSWRRTTGRGWPPAPAASASLGAPQSQHQAGRIER